MNYLNVLVLLACVFPPLLYLLDYHFDSEHKQTQKSNSVKTMQVCLYQRLCTRTVRMHS